MDGYQALEMEEEKKQVSGALVSGVCLRAAGSLAYMPAVSARAELHNQLGALHATSNARLLF